MLLRTLTKSTQWYEINFSDRQTVESKRYWWFTKPSIGALDCFNHNPLTHQCRTANCNTFSATESRLDTYLHFTGRIGFFLSLYFSHLIFASLTQIIPSHLHLYCFLLLPVSLSNAMTLENGVSRATLDFWGSNHKTFDKSVNILSATPQNHVLTNLLICRRVSFMLKVFSALLLVSQTKL